MSRTRSMVVTLLIAATVLVACGKSGGGSSTTTTSTTAKAPVVLTDSFRGVTATSIKIGFAIVDFNCAKQFINFVRPNQQGVYQAFVDNVNNHGGIGGRKIDPVYKAFCPITAGPALDACSSFTQDSKVFAIIGNIGVNSADALLCASRDHQTVTIGHEFGQSTIAQAPPGLLITPDITAERRTNVLLNLLKSQNTLAGKKVAIIGDQNTKVRADTVITPGLTALGVAQGSTAILTVTGTDTSSAQSQLDSFIEKWKGENVTALFMTGLVVSSKQFVEKVKAGMPNVLLMADGESGTKDGAQNEVAAHKSPNPYEGALTAIGDTAAETWHRSDVQNCAQIADTALNLNVLGPDVAKPGPDGNTDQTYQAVEDFCQEIDMFKQIAEKAGPNLTNQTWADAVNNFGSIKLIGNPFGSLHTSKYDADDGFRLASFDSTIPPTGDWKPLTPLQDTSKG